MRVVVFCGGRGTRAHPATVEIPKPMMRIGDTPILGHVLEIFARQGLRSFVLATGYRGEVIRDWAADLPWDVDVRDTGDDTLVGERLRSCRDLFDGPVLATYGDGLADLDLRALLEDHERAEQRGGLATVTTVPLPSQYGTLDIDATGAVRDFREKPVLTDHWINAGFFVFSPRAFDHWDGPDLERQVLPGLARRGALYTHRHRGFWKSMDTLKDQAELTALTEGGTPPWLRLPSMTR